MKTGVYKHYKGGYYQVLGVAQHTETQELCVVYISLDASKPGPRMRVRPLGGPDGFNTLARKDDFKKELTIRFEYIGDSL